MLSRNSNIELDIPFVANQPMIVNFKAKKISGIGNGIDVKVGINYIVHYKKGHIYIADSGNQFILVGDLEQEYILRMVMPDGKDIFSNKNIKIMKSAVYVFLDSGSLNSEVGISGLLAVPEDKFDMVKKSWTISKEGGDGSGSGSSGDEIEIANKARTDRVNIALGYVFGRISVDGLPRDNVNRVWYIRPWANDSFGIVGWHHITALRENLANLGNRTEGKFDKFDVVDVDWTNIGSISEGVRRSILIHPFLYPFAQSYDKNMNSLIRLFKMRWKVGGFDVTDSDRLSALAVGLINRLDLIMVPSSFSKDACIRSGVRKEIVQVLGHGIGHEMEADLGDNKRNNSEISEIRILFFNMHSDWRKGADLVGEVMRRIQRKNIGKNITLVVKSGCDVGKVFPGVKCIGVNQWLSDKDLKNLYDSCDICLSPSRGGGFELNALEAVSRGLPTLVSGGGCFTDLMNYFIPVNVGKMVQPLPSNPIHVGLGPECDINDFEKKLEDVIDRLDYWKKVFRDRSSDVRKKFTWTKVGIRLENILKQYDFIR